VSGAIVLWSLEQSERLLQQQQAPSNGDMGITPTTANSSFREDDENVNGDEMNDDDDDDGSSYSVLSRQSIPEAYRTVDASVYQSVSFQMDELHLDEDDDDDDNEYDFDNRKNRRDIERNPQPPYNNMSLYGGRNNKSSSSSSARYTTSNATGVLNSMNPTTTITMKSMIRMGIRMNLGSIIYCGLISPISEVIHTNIQYMDYLRQQRQRYRQQQQQQNNGSNSSRTGGFQGMIIGSSTISGSSDTITNTYYRIGRIVSIVRYWVQYHNDLPMSHVATYYKSYLRATRDVTSIIEESGTLFLNLFFYFVARDILLSVSRIVSIA
jgi:hypothetical protein